MSNLTNITSFMELVQFANSRTDGWMFIALLVGVFVIALASTIRWGKTIAFVVASFVSVLLSFVLSQVQLVEYVWVVVSFLALLISLMVHGLSNQNG